MRGNNWLKMSDLAILDQIGRFIKHHRLSKNISQQELARNSGITRTTLYYLENGRKSSLLTLIQVLRGLDLLDTLENFEIQKRISPIKLAELEHKRRYRAAKKKT